MRLLHCVEMSGTSYPLMRFWIQEECVPEILCTMHFYCFLNNWQILEQCKCEICDAVPLHQARGGTVVKVLCYKSEGHWFDPSWCKWNFSLT